MTSSIADIRKDYQLAQLNETIVSPDAMSQFEIWWKEAVNSQIEEVNAMTLATASCDGVPSARVVLLKGLSDQGFIFYTNYESFKGKQLAENPRACLVFFWKELERQVRITGLVSKISETESDQYYYSRPEGSRIGAWASPQSQVIESREWLESKVVDLSANQPSGRPPFWGGFIVKPISIEFWQGRSSRLHDRIQYSLTQHGTWTIERLAP